MAAARARQPRMPIEVRREQVLDAALRLISDRGYGAASMEAIAREADIAKPVVYNAYPTRGALLRALLEREEARGFGALAAALPPQPAGADATTLLMAWLRSLAHAIAEEPITWRLMLAPSHETPDEVREHVQAGRTFALEQVRTLIRSLGAQHPALAAVDLDLAAHSVLASAEHAARLMLDDPERFTPDRLVDFAQSVVRALVPS
jgi:AcrR family transcriptional regulator